VQALVLLDAQGKRYLVPPGEGAVTVEGLGVVDTGRIEARVGGVTRVAGKAFLVLLPSARDRLELVTRKAQVIGSKDAASILLNCDLNAGDIVVEAGAGSGALTTLLAQAVSPGGRVITYELREDFAALAEENMRRTGGFGNVTIRRGDVRTALVERDVDCVFLDIPDPWEAVPGAWEALRPCGYFGCFVPNTEQVRRVREALAAKPFVDVRTVELIEREIEAHEGGVRPSFSPLGHTGYLTFARKVLERLPP
jgi:tRNA (adenine57-N1/adenine58-N1)-methyltransferase